MADVGESHVVQQNLLHDERGHRLGQFTASLHDTETERDDLRLQQEVDDIRVVNLPKIKQKKLESAQESTITLCIISLFFFYLD